MKIRSAITKGRTFQKKVVDMIKKSWNMNDDDIRSPIGAEQGLDVKFSNKLKKKVNLGIEIKTRKQINLLGSLRQARDNTIKELGKGGIPAFVFRKSIQGNKDIWITIPFQHYLDLRKKEFE